jgi:hypothetical protein
MQIPKWRRLTYNAHHDMMIVGNNRMVATSNANEEVILSISCAGCSRQQMICALLAPQGRYPCTLGQNTMTIAVCRIKLVAHDQSFSSVLNTSSSLYDTCIAASFILVVQHESTLGSLILSDQYRKAKILFDQWQLQG